MPAGDTPPDLSACEQEPIHVPGSIQPHGVLIATYAGEPRISLVSANFEASVGLRAAAVLDTDLDQLLGAAGASLIAAALNGQSYAPSNVQNLKLPIPLRPYRTVLVHRHLDRVIVELENPPPDRQSETPLSKALAIIAKFRRAETMAQLCACAVREIRSLTGCDRAMVYRFDSAGNGAVIAEDRGAALEPYLNLHYPASDIPPQARRMFVLQRVRAIADVDYTPVKLLSASPLDSGLALDMTFCALRGVSPLHLEYLRNMGVKASLTISLLQDETLWGMIVCHYGAPHVVSPDLRAVCDVIGQMMSVLMRRVSEAEEMVRQLTTQQLVGGLGDDLDASDSIAEGLLRRSGALQQLMDAEGVVIRWEGHGFAAGRTPPPAEAAAIMAAIQRQHGDAVTAIDDAGLPGGVAEASAATASGILMMPLSDRQGGDAIAWFRPEVVRTVQWGGDPHKPVTIDPATQQISPRRSFAIWTEQLKGRARAWSDTEMLAAHDLHRAVIGFLLRRSEARLAQLTAIDPLTKLANRPSCEAQLKRWRLAEERIPAALLYLNLDRFKAINDALGTTAGDDMLVQLAERLRSVAPAGSVPGRLGSDEFMLFWPGAGQQEAETLASVVAADLAQPFLLQRQPHYASVSVGIACSATSGSDDLLRAADAAMNAAKRLGGGKAVTFEPQLHMPAARSIQTEQDLFRALDHDELEIHYQPIMTVANRTICGFEALLRWCHPENGWVSPVDFIPIAEATGLITRIGASVLAGAIRQLGQWRRLNSELTVSVNVSPHQLIEVPLSENIADLLEREGVPAKALCIEVTESALMHQAAVWELRRIDALGVAVAVDDFGTGYSSLSYLQSLPVSTVKIDRSFVSPLGSSPRADRFFRSIIELAHTLDLRAVAEGCETEEQWRVIADVGCEAVQGWLISRPMNATAATQFLSRASALQFADKVSPTH